MKYMKAAKQMGEIWIERLTVRSGCYRELWRKRKRAQFEPSLSILIVSTAGNNPQKSIFINVVDESVYIINSSAPRFFVTKRFRFTDSCTKAIPFNGFNEIIDSF